MTHFLRFTILIVSLINTSAFADNTLTKKGPYGNTAKTFGFNDLYIGMKINDIHCKNGHSKNGHYNTGDCSVSINGKVFNVSASRHIIDASLLSRGSLKIANLYEKLRSFNLMGEVSNKNAYIRNKYNTNTNKKNIITLRLPFSDQDKENGAVHAIRLHVVNNTILGMDLSKNYIGSGISLSEFYSHIENKIGPPRFKETEYGSDRAILGYDFIYEFANRNKRSVFDWQYFSVEDYHSIAISKNNDEYIVSFNKSNYGIYSRYQAYAREDMIRIFTENVDNAYAEYLDILETMLIQAEESKKEFHL